MKDQELFVLPVVASLYRKTSVYRVFLNVISYYGRVLKLRPTIEVWLLWYKGFEYW